MPLVDIPMRGGVAEHVEGRLLDTAGGAGWVAQRDVEYERTGRLRKRPALTPAGSRVSVGGDVTSLGIAGTASWVEHGSGMDAAVSTVLSPAGTAAGATTRAITDRASPTTRPGNVSPVRSVHVVMTPSEGAVMGSAVGPTTYCVLYSVPGGIECEVRDRASDVVLRSVGLSDCTRAWVLYAGTAGGDEVYALVTVGIQDRIDWLDADSTRGSATLGLTPHAACVDADGTVHVAALDGDDVDLEAWERDATAVSDTATLATGLTSPSQCAVAAGPASSGAVPVTVAAVTAADVGANRADYTPGAGYSTPVGASTNAWPRDAVSVAVAHHTHDDCVIWVAEDQAAATPARVEAYTYDGTSLDNIVSSWNVPQARLLTTPVLYDGWFWAWIARDSEVDSTGATVQGEDIIDQALVAVAWDASDTNAWVEEVMVYALGATPSQELADGTVRWLYSMGVQGGDWYAALPVLYRTPATLGRVSVTLNNGGYSFLRTTESLDACRTEVFVARFGGERSVARLGDVTLFAGGDPHITDGAALYPVSLEPISVYDVSPDGTGSLSGTFIACATAEWYDVAGRRYQSTPSRFWSVAPSSDAEIDFRMRARRVSEPLAIALWRSEDDGTTVFKTSELQFLGFNAYATATDDNAASYESNEVLYTDIEPARLPPGPLSVVGAAGGRFWGARGRRVWYTHQAILGEGPQFCAGVFFVEIQETVTAIGELDQVPVVFSRDSVYQLLGDGPGRSGAGAPFRVDRVSDEVGCVSHASVVQTRDGLMFQSRRGIELLPRGASQVIHIGEGVEQTLAAHPHVVGAEVRVERQQACFLAVDDIDAAASARVLVYDMAERAWHVWDISPESATLMRMGIMRTDDGETLVVSYGDELAYLTDATYPAAGYTVETGDMRPAGLQRAGRWRSVTVLGEYLQDTSLTVAVSYDGGYSWPDSVTWSITSSDYDVGQPVRLQYSVPRHGGDTLRVRVTDDGAGEFDFAGVALHALTVDYEPEAGPSRLQKGARG